MSDFLFALCLISILVACCSALGFLIKWITRKPKKRWGVVTLVSFVLFWVFGFFAASLDCDGEYIEISRTQATCTAPGKVELKCKECGDTKSETIEPTGHSFIEISRIEPTTDKEGKVVNQCEKCGEEEIIVLDKLTPVEEPTATPKTDEKETEAKEDSETIDISVSFADIYREFERNELVAKDLYNGNRYEITAEINAMSTSGLLNLTGGATLTMKSRVDNTIVFFYAEFDKEQEENLKQISVGDTITFIGTCYSGNFTDCELQ